jgi:hypothetical protein
MRIRCYRCSLLLLVGLLISAPGAHAKGKKAKTPEVPPTDGIEVVGHIPAANGPVTRLVSTHHYSSFYLYAEQAGHGLTLIDVTEVKRPAVLTSMPPTPEEGQEGLFAVAGTAAIVTNQPGAAAPAATLQTVRIMDFSDPTHPKVVREFTGVTAIGRENERGLIFVANADGVWILRQHFAEDPEVEKEYAKRVSYDH